MYRQIAQRGSKASRPPPKTIEIEGRRLPVSSVLDTFFHFVTERHKVHLCRTRGDQPPWTTDPILQQWPFANVFRVFDRTSQFILRNVIGKGDEDMQETIFRVILFRSFNKMETWEQLKEALGPELTWKDFSVEAYEQVLLALNGPIYGSAYIMPGAKLGAKTNASNSLRLIQLLMEEGAPRELLKRKHLKDAHGYLRLYPSMGDFTALQYVLTCSLTTITMI